MKNNTPKKSRIVYGVGINDADYIVCPTINGKRVRCPFYAVWMDMLKRCYSLSFKKSRPSYIGCTVDKEWLIFSNFKSWMLTQDWNNKSIDKDILIQNNKIYSCSSCIFVSPSINNILLNRGADRGKYPLGVYENKSNRYVSRCKVFGKDKYIGHYDTPEEAYEAYKKFKYKHIAEIANQQSEPLRTALLNYVIEG
jgi:hypothetical protein